jgi:hypothetical protein
MQGLDRAVHPLLHVLHHFLNRHEAPLFNSCGLPRWPGAALAGG